MSELKTKATNQSVEAFIETISDPTKQADCSTLIKMITEITNKPAQMWGSSIVGFDQYHYKYASGQEGDWPIIGFSPRKQNLTIYIMNGYEDYQDLLAKIGPHKLGKSCLYVKKLADLDQEILKELMRRSVAYMRGNYPTQK